MNGNTTVIILGGGQGKRLFPLTRYRSKPAVPIGGKYRLVDIPISNAIHSGFRKIFVLTQFNSTSLHRHIHRTYPYEPFNQTSVELLAAEQTLANADWFQGTADAVRKHMSHYLLQPEDTVLVLSGDHLYRMDYRKIIQYHHEKNADVTLSTIPVAKSEASQFGILQISASGQITAFHEKPAPEENVHSFVMPSPIRKIFSVQGSRDLYLASMGIYVFKAKVLEEALKGNEADFGKEVIPKSIDRFKVYGYVFNGYWRDIGTIASFYKANIEMTKLHPYFSFHNAEWRIFTRPRFLPPTNIKGCTLHNTLMGEGCVLEGSEIQDSVVGLRSVVRKGSFVSKSILMGNDYYDLESRSQYPLGLGKNCRIEKCILDKNVRIGNDVTIANLKNLKEADGENYFIRDRMVIIPKGVTIPSGTKI